MPRFNWPEWQAVRSSLCWPCCEEGHSHAVLLARELSYQLIREYNSTGYDVHGRFGIFADGDRIAHKYLHGRPKLDFQAATAGDYAHAKTRFIYSKLCEHARTHGSSRRAVLAGRPGQEPGQRG